MKPSDWNKLKSILNECHFIKSAMPFCPLGSIINSKRVSMNKQQ